MTIGRKKTLDRALSRAGLCSRTEARERIAQGRVTVHGKVVRDPERWVDPVTDRIACDGAPVQAAAKQVWMLHKPTGFVTTRDDEHDRPTVYEFLPDDAPWLGPVGRLDLDTSGLLLFTNDGDLANAITDPETGCAKTYVARCRGELGDDALQALAHGVELGDGPTLPARVRVLAREHGDTTIELRITEGRNRQVRRMLTAIGSKVLALHRTHVGALALGELPVGHARRLTRDEVVRLRDAVTPRRDPRRPRTNRDRAR